MVGCAFLIGRSSQSCVLLCPVWLAFANCFYALLTVFSHKVTWKVFLCFSFWHGLHGNLLIATVMDAVRWGYLLLRALARRLISSHSAILSGCVRLDSLYSLLWTSFSPPRKMFANHFKLCEQKARVSWNSWSQLLLPVGPTKFCKQEYTK